MNYKCYKIMDWMGPIVLRKVEYSEAKKKYAAFLEHKDDRVNELQKLFEGECRLNFTIDSLQCINEIIWTEAPKYFKENRGEFMRGNASIEDSLKLSDFGVPASALWRSIASDCAIYIVEMLQRESSHLRWTFGPFYKNETTKNYPQVTGFRNIDDKKYRATPHFILERYFNSKLSGDEGFMLEKDFIVSVYSGMFSKL